MDSYGLVDGGEPSPGATGSAPTGWAAAVQTESSSIAFSLSPFRGKSVSAQRGRAYDGVVAVHADGDGHCAAGEPPGAMERVAPAADREPHRASAPGHEMT